MIGWPEIICIAIAAFWMYYYYMSTYNIWKELGIAGPQPIPILGTVKDVVFERMSMADYVKEVYHQYKKHKMFGIFIVKEPQLVLADFDLIQDVLITDFSNFADRGVAFCEKADPLSPHLFNLEPKRWRPLRSRLSPIFTPGKLKDMFRMIGECSENLVKMLTAVAEKGEPVDIYEITSRFTTDVIGTCAFGIDAHALTDDACEFREMGRHIFEPSRIGITKGRCEQLLPSLYKMLSHFMKQDYLNTFFSKITLETMKHRRENKIYRNDFINTLLDLQDHPEKLGDLELTDQLIVAQAFIFFAAGFESSATTISNVLYELALNQHVQSKLRTEMKETLTKDSDMDYETLRSMQYLDAVLKETLRKYPPGPNLRRKAENSYTFRGTEITIPAGQRIMIPVYAIHRDPTIFPNPDAFDPDRFRDGNGEIRHPMHYIPFGDGPRNCIGLRLANHQTKLGLIKIIRDFKIDVCNKTPIPYVIHPRAFMMTPRDPIYLRISKCEDS